MKKGLVLIAAVILMAFVASAGTVSYNTSGSTLSCDHVANCTQVNAASIELGGITLTYDPITNATTVPSEINLGELVTSGTGVVNGVSFVGVVLVIDIDDVTIGKSGDLPAAGFTGTVSTSSTTLQVNFGAGNTTVPLFGDNPGVVLSGTQIEDTYQTYPAIQFVVDPTSNSGITTLQGDLTQAPEPITLSMLGGGLIGLSLLKRKRFTR